MVNVLILGQLSKSLNNANNDTSPNGKKLALSKKKYNQDADIEDQMRMLFNSRRDAVIEDQMRMLFNRRRDER